VAKNAEEIAQVGLGIEAMQSSGGDEGKEVASAGGVVVATDKEPCLAIVRISPNRKNWLFVGNDDAAEVNAAFVSLLASCQFHNVEPWAYLRDLFCLLPSWPIRRVLELAPLNWKQTLRIATLSSVSTPTSSGGRPSACSTTIDQPSSTRRRRRQRRCSPNGYLGTTLQNRWLQITGSTRVLAIASRLEQSRLHRQRVDCLIGLRCAYRGR
jgi:hypothetical protein